jgi:putative peptidoglycan lipid II flippase
MVSVARAAAVSALLASAGSACGLVRDLLVAAFFGATEETDAFVVAWTVPETVAPLLVEGTMAMVMVPAFGRALETLRSSAGTVLDPVRELIEATVVRVVLVLSVVGAVVALAAPALIAVLAPGLSDPVLAARCMRLVAATIPLLGLAGYLAAALRTHGRFAAPATIYLAYNVGIVATILLLHQRFGVVAAALGILVGAALMVVVQVPASARVLPWPRSLSVYRSTELLGFAAFLPVAVHTVLRQGQTFVERFAAARLAEGTISHLNYAQKVCQIPITLSFMAAAVTFPIFARSVAAGSDAAARRRMETDLLVMAAIALTVTAYLVLFAPSVVTVLFERGAFTPVDTLRTSEIMRVYAFGLLGQTVVSLLVRPFFTYAGVVWFPAGAMAVGLVATMVATFALVGPFGAAGIAAANALGISITALVLATGAGRRLSTAPSRAAYRRLWVLAAPLAVAVTLGAAVDRLLRGSPAVVVAGTGGLVMVASVAGLAVLTQRLARLRTAR